MSDENAPAPEATDADGAVTEVPAKKSRGNRAPRKPSFKDWVRVINSQGNGCTNQTIHLVVNEATNVCTLITNANASEDSEDMEGERKQIFRITGYEVINVPDEEGSESEEAQPAEAAAE